MVVNYTLPVLDYAAELCQLDLQNTGVLARQHILSTTYALFERLFAKGLKPQNTFLLGKCYSTDQETLNRFLSVGAHVSPDSCAFDSHRSFDEQSADAIERLLQTASPKLSALERVLVIDDGGDLILAANGLFKMMAGVEQTSSGYRKISAASLQYPVVNVARSDAKLRTESPMIADVIAKKLRPYLTNDSNILVVGNGAIGNSVYNLLGQHYSVTSYDVSTDKQALFRNGKLKLSEYDMIVGCTGSTILQPEQLKYCKQGAVLASASSSDIEFQAHLLRRKMQRTADCHQAIAVDGITLLNSGFPINFDGSAHSVSPEKIQFTRALLLAGAYQALNSNARGIIELDKSLQDNIMQQYELLNK
jgi:S-adenosylhomocysteine hydrolase